MPPPPPPLSAPRLNPPSFSNAPSPNSRMLPPPPRPSGSSLRPPPSSASTLRAPPTASSSLSASTLPLKPNKATSRAVTLSPGHSPLDWAHLTRSPASYPRLVGRSFTLLVSQLTSHQASSTPPSNPLLRIPPSTLKLLTGRPLRPPRHLRPPLPFPTNPNPNPTPLPTPDAWTSFSSRIYNLTAYLPFHPGGEPEILKGAGRDSGKLFAEIHPWVNFEGMLGECLVGVLVAEEDPRAVKVVADLEVEGGLRVVGGFFQGPSKRENGGEEAENGETGNPLDEMD